MCVVALAAVGVHGGLVASVGSSSQFRSEDGLGNYNFGYDEAHPTGGSFRRESGSVAGIKAGSYGLRDIDGRVRVVNYVADGAGFRAAINTNEPGTAPSLSAAAAYNAAPVVAKAAVAPVVAAAATYATPVAAAAAPTVAAYAHPAPVMAPLAAPVAAAKATSYSTAVNHGTVHAAPVAAVAPAVAAYAHHHVAAPAVAHYSAGPAVTHYAAAPAVAHYISARQAKVVV